MTMLYFLLPYGNICSLIRLFYKISYIFMFRKIVCRCAFTRIRPQALAPQDTDLVVCRRRIPNILFLRNFAGTILMIKFRAFLITSISDYGDFILRGFHFSGISFFGDFALREFYFSGISFFGKFIFRRFHFSVISFSRNFHLQVFH